MPKKPKKHNNSKRNVRNPCGVCSNPVAVTHNAIWCDLCNFWIHAKCNNTTAAEYLRLQLDENKWFCQKCYNAEMPFSTISHEDLKLTLQGKNLDLFLDPENDVNLQFYRDIESALAQDDDGDNITSPYLSLGELNQMHKNQETISTLHLNIASLNLHFGELESIISNCYVPFNFIGITETGFKDENKAKTSAELSNYKHFDCCTKSSKGGARIYVSEGFHTLPRKDLQIYKKNEIESVVREVVYDKNFIVACIYKHPDADATYFQTAYSNLLDKITSENKKAIIFGDFNLDLLKAESKPIIDDFLNSNLTHCFLPTITRPTRINPKSKTLIDNIFTNFVTKKIESCNLICIISDHLPQILKLDLKPRIAPKVKISKRDMRRFNEMDFILDFITIDWVETLSNKNTSERLEAFISKVNSKIDVHAPIKTSWKKAQPPKNPWITRGLLKSITTKNSLYKKFLKAKDPELKSQKHDKFKKHRNLLSKLIRISKNNYYKTFFSDNSHNLKQKWKVVNEIIGTKSKSDLSPKLLLHGNVQITNDKDIAETFNNFYGSVADHTKNKIPQTDKTFNEYLGDPNLSSIFLTRITPAEVIKIINKLDNQKAYGPSSIPTYFLKLVAPTAGILLSQIFNNCIMECSYPECLKKATIKPLHKKDSKLDVGNYRPISLLSNINKIFEKLLHCRLVKFFENNNLLCENQFGFRKGHSTNHAIIALTEIIRKSLDKNNFAAGVFIDLQKAFDTVDHSILLHKLEHYGVRGPALELFKSYLNDRTHCVEIRNTSSKFIPIKHGVPQGSVLGPLFFIIYINDLHLSLENSTTIHFADDTSLVCCDESIKSLNRKVNRDLALLVHWLRANKISLNTSKTEIVLFRTTRKIITKHLNFRLSGQKLNLSSKTKYLGIILDEHLSWDPQIHDLTAKLSRSVGFLSKLRHFVDYKTLISVYFALFDSHINYCLQAIGYITQASFDKLEVLQNKALRLIHFKPARHSSRPLFIRSGILPLKKQLKVKNCLFALDHVNNKLPNYFSNFLRFSTHIEGTRQSPLRLEPPTTNTVRFGSYSIATLISKDWNELHTKVKITDLKKVSKETLKDHLRRFLLTKIAES